MKFASSVRLQHEHRRGQHYTRATVSAPRFCRKCNKTTQHRIEDRKLGACLECIDRQEDEYRKRHGLPPIERKKPNAMPAIEELIEYPCTCNAIANCWDPPRPHMPHYHTDGMP
jgi:ribosomal protein L44E